MKHRLAMIAMMLLPLVAAAQGVSTSGVRGRVATEGGQVAARVEIRNVATGFTARVSTRDGYFLIQGLEPGGPYSLTASAIGFVPSRHEGIVLQVGETREISIRLNTAEITLDTITVAARGDQAVALGGGSGMVIDTTILVRMPTLNRDLYDFVRLVPQISTKITLSNPGLSGAGTGFRFNNFLINGISDRTISGSVSNTFSGMRSIPLDAVREYQVLLSPYDVRYGDFAGALVNAVTRSGTNRPRGSAFIYARTDQLARSNSYPANYERIQYGITASGPVIKDRVHYFLAGELQSLSFRATGAYIGQPASSSDTLRVTRQQIDEFSALMTRYGLTAGTGNRVQNTSPLENFFGQLNFSLPSMSSRGAAWINFGRSNELSFSRVARDTFSLTSTAASRNSVARIVALRLNTTINRRGGGSNEFLASRRAERLDPRPRVVQPVIRVSVPSVTGSEILLNSGTPEFAQGTWVRANSYAIKDNVSLPLDARNVLIFGAELERFHLARGGLGSSFGMWSFSSMEDFSRGIADRYDVRIDLGSAKAPVSGSQYSAFAGDQWSISPSVTLTGGLRADFLAVDGHAPYDRRVDSLYGRRTDTRPPRRIEVSPRVGFSWRASDGHTLRGGAGIFTTRYPIAWIHSTLSSYGLGGTLTCVRPTGGFGPPPAFLPDPLSPPKVCAGGSTITSDFKGEVDLVDPHLRMMRVARTSIAHEWDLGHAVSLTSEAMFTRSLSDFVFVNLRLNEPLATNLQGRVIYNEIRTSGVIAPDPRPDFVEVIDVRNTSQNHAYQISTRLEKIGRGGSGGSASYTFSRVRDVQTPVRVNTTGRVAWASARVVSGRHDELKTSVSANDIPHRVVLQGIYAYNWRPGRLDLSFYYVGESGRPFTYVSFGTRGRGDLNGDRAIGNDPIYIPRNVRDTAEILFSGISDSTGADNGSSAQSMRIANQIARFESLIDRTSCMKSQRGKILARNSCREPWSNTTIASIRQGLTVFGQPFELQLDAFNVLNVLNRSWGSRREAIPSLLEHVGQTQGTPGTSKPIFRLTRFTSQWTTLPVESSFQLQFAVRYRF